MSYVETVLGPGERLMHVGQISMWGLTGKIVLGLVLLPIFGLGLVFWISAWIHYKSTELAVTDRRVMAKFGFIRRHTYEMNLDKVESLQVEQGLWGRMLDFGTILVRGTGSSFEPVPGISEPVAFRNAVMTAIDSRKAPR